MHEAEPFAVAAEGDDCVDGVEAGIEVYSFIEVKADAYGVDGNPYGPLLDVFAGEHPHAYDAEGSGEGVGHGDGAVGEIFENQVEQSPQGEGGGSAESGHAPWRVGDGEG